MSTHPDVLVIGGGVIGLTTAYYLTGAAASVVVVDKGDLGREASWAGAGILTPGVVRDGMPPWEYLKALGSQMYPELSARLKEQTRIDNGYMLSGGLEVIESDANLDSDEWRTPDVEVEELSYAAITGTLPDPRAEHSTSRLHTHHGRRCAAPRHLQALLIAAAVRSLRGDVAAELSHRAAWCARVSHCRRRDAPGSAYGGAAS